MIKVPRTRIDPLFYDLISYCTPHGTENRIVDLILSQNFMADADYEIIDGNLVVRVGKDYTTMFSAHMDIVGEISKTSKALGLVDEICFLENPKEADFLYGAKEIYKGRSFDHYEATTLGADDKVGCFILCKLIEQKTPGIYIFHVGEECGGIGSAKIVKDRPGLVTGISRAIAYDRAGYEDVICYQRGGRCCSKEFGEALAKALNENMPPFNVYKSEVTGSFTDTANYRELIPECTNISCGYFDQHGTRECIDYVFLMSILLPAALAIDYEALPTVRDPKEKPVVTTRYYAYENEDYDDYEGGIMSGWFRGNKHAPNSFKKKWVDCTEFTPVMDMPLWTPEVGYIEEAKPKVLVKAMHHYITTNYNKRTEFCTWVSDLMEINLLLLDEVRALKKEIEAGNTLGTPKVFDIEIQQRKDILNKLINLTQCGIAVRQKDKVYAQKARDFLEYHKNKTRKDQFAKKAIQKYNRFIFNLAFWLSLDNTSTNDTREFLNTVSEFINAHASEVGFIELVHVPLDLNSKRILIGQKKEDKENATTPEQSQVSPE